MSTTSQPTVTPERIMQLTWGYGASLILEAAIRAGVFDFLNSGAKTVEETASHAGTSVRGTRAIMNALVGLGLLSKDAAGRYALTPESATFLVSSKPGFMGGLARHTSSMISAMWLRINETVRRGGPEKGVNQQDVGTDFFQEFVADLFPLGYAASQKVGDALGIANAKAPMKVLDLAAGSGAWSIALAQKSPQVSVTAVDWPGVINVTRKTVARFGLTDRYTFVEGDLASANFGSGHHVATLGHILHSEGEARSRALLRKTFQAMAPGGTIMIAEFLVNEDRTGPPMSLLFAVTMLVATDQGDTYSFGEISGWLREAGFEDCRLLEIPGPSPLILATRPA